MRFTDHAGLVWEVMDYTGSHPHRKRVSLGNWKADGRAFVPVDREGPVLLYAFGLIAHRDAEERNLMQQLSFAKPATATQGERMQRN